jgi:hypothetical protein
VWVLRMESERTPLLKVYPSGMALLPICIAFNPRSA